MKEISIELIRKNLRDFFDRMDSSSVYFHTSLSPLGRIQEVNSLEQACAAYSEILQETKKDKQVFLPTFNYDFPKTKIFRPLEDPCQVGSLNEYIRKQYPQSRTLTPIFNFVCLGKWTPEFHTAPVDNPFGEDSFFADCCRAQTDIAFLGIPCNCNTFVHHVEELVNVGYRYFKVFHGTLSFGGRHSDICLTYRVRPMSCGDAVYDWVKMQAEMIAAGIMNALRIGNGQCLVCRADRMRDFLLNQVQNDEMYMLRQEYRQQIQELASKVGYPFQLDQIET